MKTSCFMQLAPYLRHETFYTGDAHEDAHTRELMQQFHAIVRAFPDHFDETTMFQVRTSAAYAHKARERM